MRIHQSLAQQIGTAIVSGEISPGDPLPGEIEQAAALGVSRTPYREAIRTLVAKGLVESRPRFGTRVLPRNRWNILDPQVLAWMFMGTPDPIVIRDLFELRSRLEPWASRLAAQRRNDEQLEQMRQALEDMRQHGLHTESGRHADQRFHHLILQAANNRALLSLASSIGAAIRWTTQYKHEASEHPRDPLPDHHAVLDAIAAGDGDAADTATSLLLDLAYDDIALTLRR